MCFWKLYTSWSGSCLYLPSLRLSTSCGLFVSPAHHRLTTTTTTNTLLMDCPDGSFGTSLREPRASWQIKISSNWFPAGSWKSETYILLVSSDTQTSVSPSVHCKRKYPWRTSGFTQCLNNHEMLYFIFENNSMLCYQLFQPTSMYPNYVNWRW